MLYTYANLGYLCLYSLYISKRSHVYIRKLRVYVTLINMKFSDNLERPVGNGGLPNFTENVRNQMPIP